MNRRKKLSMAAIVIAIVLTLAIGIVTLYIKGPLGRLLLQEETVDMAAEMALLFAVLFFILHWKDRAARSMGLAAAVIIFTWMHQVFTSVVLSGMYVAFLFLLGKLCKRVINHGRRDSCDFVENGMIDFLLGCSVFITFVCMVSLVGKGSIGQLQKIVILAGATLFAWELIEYREDLDRLPVSLCRKDNVMIAIVLVMVLLQAGRMNIALDYDSIHYGLRSEYILDSGRGIYENMGLNNVVYTYPKGLEILVLPLSGLASHSDILSFSLWMGVGVLAMIYKIVKKFSTIHGAWLAAAAGACIPGIMNMGISAKTDMITLLFQLMFIYFILCLLEYRRNRYLVFALGAFLITWIFKPTALVFSAIIFLAAFIYLAATKRITVRWRDRWWLTLLPVLLAWLGTWYRTWKMTGMPMTSIFTSIFERLGFQLKYPFAFSGIPGNGGGAFSLEGLRLWMKRLYGVVFSPVGEDMSHVVIAWGTGLVFVLAVIIAAAAYVRRGNQGCETKAGVRYLQITTLFVAVGSLVSIRLLWQVDGNYFMLLYALLVILGVIAIGSVEDKKFSEKTVYFLLPVFLFNVSVTMVTNWAGVTGFSPVNLVHQGYLDHKNAAHEAMVSQGNEKIWEELALNPQTRVLAVGQEPDVLVFPCNVQTYNDVTGSGGNVVLVKTLDNFKEFLRYARTEYIYVQSGYVGKDTRVYDVIRYMIEDGSLADVRTEHGNMIARVNLDGQLTANPKESLSVFDNDYYLKEETTGGQE